MRAVVAFVLGALAAIVVGCGGGGGGTIPKSQTGKIKDHLNSVQASLSDKDCDQIPSKITLLNSDLTNLRADGVPDKLLRNLRQGVEQLSSTAKSECAAATETVPTDTTPTTETVVPTETDTVPADTTPADTGTATTDPGTDTSGGGGVDTGPAGTIPNPGGATPPTGEAGPP